MANHDPIASPSSLPSLAACPGGGKQRLGVKQTVTEAMNEGNDQHELIADCIRAARSGSPLPNVPKKYLPAITRAIDKLNIVANNFNNPEVVLVEYTLQKLGAVGIETGTLDFAIIEGNRAGLIDFKFGESFVDAPAYNWQTKCYAVALREEYPQLTEVAAYIVQPNIDEEYQLRMATYTTEVLDDAKVKISAIVALAKGENPPLVPGTKQCQFCRAKLTCPARQEQTMLVPFGTLDIDAYLRQLTAVQAGDLYARAEFVANYCKVLMAKMVDEAVNNGMEVDGYEVAEGRSTSVWTEGAGEVLEGLAEEAGLPRHIVYEPVGITKAGELFGKSKAVKAALATVTEKKPGKLTLRKVK